MMDGLSEAITGVVVAIVLMFIRSIEKRLLLKEFTNTPSQTVLDNAIKQHEVVKSLVKDQEELQDRIDKLKSRINEKGN